MMNKTTLSAIVLSVISLILAGTVAIRTPEIGPVGPQGPQGVQGAKGDRGAQGPVGPRGPSGTDAALQLGAVPTLDGVQYPYVNINGVRQYWYSQPMAATSSTVCSIKNPFGTTTQVLSYFAQVGTNRLGAQNVTLATSSDQYLASAGPAFLKAAPVGAGGWNLSWTGLATTTAVAFVWGNDGANGESYTKLAANEYLNLKIASTTPGVFAGGYNGGVCGGVFQTVAR